jgi:DNA-binding PadR family transcriptional regulator
MLFMKAPLTASGPSSIFLDYIAVRYRLPLFFDIPLPGSRMTTRKRRPATDSGDRVGREVLVAFFKVHILHHAANGPVYGLWMIEELAAHGYRLSPGTLYPLLARLERNGWLRSQRGLTEKSRRHYRITSEGRRVLARLRRHVEELHREVVTEAKKTRR